MKHRFYSLLLVILSMPCLAQNIGMGTLNPDPSAQVEISSNARGLLIPRMDSLTVTGIKSPAKGLMVYDTARNQLLVNMGTAVKPVWRNLIEQSGWSLSGNRLGGNNAQSLGSLDRSPVNFILNGHRAGTLSDTIGIVTLGYGTPAFDSSKLFDANERAVTAVGHMSMSSIGLNGGYNTAVGAFSMSAATSGAFNTAVGDGSMQHILSGNRNTAIGEAAMTGGTYSGACTAVGGAALANNNGNLNTAVGASALSANNTGGSNTAVGANALESTPNSSYNTAVGYQAGGNFDNSHDNVFVGALADANRAGLINVVALGEGATCTSNSQVRIGNTQTFSIGGFVNWTNFSDGRFKKNMKEDVKGLDFIMRLRPITYTLDMDGIEASMRPGKQDTLSEGRRALKAARAATVTTGFVAQEVEKAASDLGYDFSGVDKPKNDGDFYGLRYAEFIAPMVKAMQEQQKIIDTQNRAIDALRNTTNELKERLDALEKQIKR